MEPIMVEEIRAELKRVLESRHFAKAKKRSRFLEFVCEQTLLGNAEKLSEYVIGMDVYERGPGFDPQDDAIVRVQACEIRKSLKEYYSEGGGGSALRIDLPASHYVPVFARRPEGVASRWTALAAFLRRQALAIALAVACAVFAVLWIGARSHPSPPPQAVIPESAEWFWKPFLPPAPPPLVAIPNHPLLRAAHEGDSAATLGRSHLIPKDELPEFRDTIHFRELAGFHFVPSMTDFTSVGETLGLLDMLDFFGRAGQKLEVKPARLVDYDAIKRGNAVLLGGNQAWSGRIFLYTEGFWFHNGVITNKTPQPGEQPVYKPEFDAVTNSLRRDYALVLMLPNENRDQRILLIYGIYTQGSQAAIQYLTSPKHLEELRPRLAALSPDKRSLPRFFQVLLTATVENSVPGKVSFVSARAIPE